MSKFLKLLAVCVVMLGGFAKTSHAETYRVVVKASGAESTLGILSESASDQTSMQEFFLQLGDSTLSTVTMAKPGGTSYEHTVLEQNTGEGLMISTETRSVIGSAGPHQQVLSKIELVQHMLQPLRLKNPEVSIELVQ